MDEMDQPHQVTVAEVHVIALVFRLLGPKAANLIVEAMSITDRDTARAHAERAALRFGSTVVH